MVISYKFISSKALCQIINHCNEACLYIYIYIYIYTDSQMWVAKHSTLHCTSAIITWQSHHWKVFSQMQWMHAALSATQQHAPLHSVFIYIYIYTIVLYINIHSPTYSNGHLDFCLLSLSLSLFLFPLFFILHNIHNCQFDNSFNQSLLSVNMKPNHCLRKCFTN